MARDWSKPTKPKVRMSEYVTAPIDTAAADYLMGDHEDFMDWLTKLTGEDASDLGRELAEEAASAPEVGVVLAASPDGLLVTISWEAFAQPLEAYLHVVDHQCEGGGNVLSAWLMNMMRGLAWLAQHHGKSQ